MEIQKHIVTFLQLYEFSMSIGKSLSFNEVCSDFIKLVLKRKSLSAAWVLEVKQEESLYRFSIPKPKSQSINLDKAAIDHLTQLNKIGYYEIDATTQQLNPLGLNHGFLICFKLKTDRFLFFYSKDTAFTEMEYKQLKPVVDKFSVALEACEVYESQIKLSEKLEHQNKELSEYAHMVSHDLKSPLRSIDTMASWLKEDHEKDLGEDGIQKIEQIRSNVEKMDALIGGILDYSTVGKSQRKIQQVDLNVLLKELVDFIDIPKHIKVTLEGEFPSIKGDKHRLQQLFQNLIVNAISCNDKQEGWVKIGYNTDKEFYVEDNGKGIEPGYLDKIFNAFFKLENKPQSVGLGLSIVKKIVVLHQGKIWIKSRVKEGTTFFFTLNNEKKDGGA